LPIFFSLYREAQDGVLVVASHDLTRRVYLRGGAPVSYDSTARQDTLAAWLVDRGRIRADEAEAVMVARAQGLRIGAALAEAGVNLEGEELLGVLREYTREKVAQVLDRKSVV